MIRKLLLRYSEMAGAFVAIAAFFASVFVFFGADLPPWASQTRAETVAEDLKKTDAEASKKIDEVKRDQSVMTRALLRLDRTYWEKQLEEAEKDLKANPNSVTAKKAKKEAEDQIAYIDEQLKPDRGL